MKERLIAIYPQTSYAERRTAQSMTNGEEQVRQTPPTTEATPRMAQERAGEGQPRQAEPRQKDPRLGPRFVTPEDSRRAWEQHDRGRQLTEEERQTRERLIASGIPPVAGGAPDISLDGIIDARLRSLGEAINEQIAAVGERIDFLNERWRDVSAMNGTIPEDQKRLLLQRITDAMRRARGQEEEAMRRRVEKGIYGERKLTPEEETVIKLGDNAVEIDRLFNRIHDKVDNQPQREFERAFGQVGAFELAEFLRTLNDGRTEAFDAGETQRAERLDSLIRQYSNEHDAREMIHNAYFGVLSGSDTEAIAKYVDRFQSGYGDMAMEKTGVTTAMHFYEQALLKVREENGGYLPVTEVVGDIEHNRPGRVHELAKEYLEKANKAGLIKKNAVPITLNPWQIERALSFARGMLIILGRTIEIAASSTLPEGAQGASAFTDQYAQRIIAQLAPFRHSLKFNVRSKFTRVLAFFMNRDRKPWSPSELEEFEAMKMDEQMRVLNGSVEEGKERFYGVLNPLEIGSVVSRTGWRIAGEREYPGITLISHMLNPDDPEHQPGDENWIGTGVWIEKERDKLSSQNKDKAKRETERENAKRDFRTNFEKMKRQAPLRLFFNVKSIKEKTLDALLTSEYFTDEDRRRITPLQGDARYIAIMKNKELREDIDELVLRQEVLLQERKNSLEELAPPTRASVTRLTQSIRSAASESEINKLIETYRDNPWKIPYVFATDDVPWDRYKFERTGARSIARRWGDMASAAQASKALTEEYMELIENAAQLGPELMPRLVEGMRKIYRGIRGYNEDYARLFVLRLAEGTMKFFGKGWVHRIPYVGNLLSLSAGNASYAQIVYGKGAPAWNEVELNEFTRLLRSGEPMLTLEQQHTLQERAGGGLKESTYWVVRTLPSLMLLALTVYVLSKAVQEKERV